MRRLRLLGWTLALASSVAGASCQRLAGRPARGSLFEGQAAVGALAQLRQAAGGPRLRCLEVTVYADRAELQFQKPGDAANADAYRYESGLVSGPLPVKLVGGGRLEDSVFPLAEVDLEALPGLFAEALRQAGLEGGHVEQLRIRRELSPLSPATRRVLRETGHGPAEDFPDGAVVLQLSISGTRRNATVRADARGRVVAVKVI